MAVQESETQPFHTATDLTHLTPTAGAEGGAGGSAMAVWGYDRDEQFNTLLNGSFTNNSDYSLAAGVVDLDSKPFDLSFPDAERPLDDPAPSVTAGEGGGDMLAWYYDRAEMIRTLATRSFTNQSSFSFPIAVVDSAANPFDLSFPDTETYHDELPGSGEHGTGGSEMDLWGSDRITILQTVANGSYTNYSDYPIPKGVVDSSSEPFAISFPDGERPHNSNVPYGVLVGFNYYDLIISGRVLAVDPTEENPEEGFAIGGATVRTEHGGQEFHTSPEIGENGGYALSIGEHGEYTVRVEHPVLPNVSQTVDVPEGTDIEGIDLLLPLMSVEWAETQGGGVRGLSIGSGVHIG